MLLSSKEEARKALWFPPEIRAVASEVGQIYPGSTQKVDIVSRGKWMFINFGWYLTHCIGSRCINDDPVVYIVKWSAPVSLVNICYHSQL